jgi:hypothetical protein
MSLRSSSSRATFRYEECSSCRGVIQSLQIQAGRQGLGTGAFEKQKIEILKEIIEFNRHNEKRRRVFRFTNSRCRCDVLGDELHLASQTGSSELKLRQDDYLRPDVADDGWYKDPSGLHRLRYWNGASWTNWISDDGATSQTAAPVFPNNWVRLLPGEKSNSSINLANSTAVQRSTRSSKTLTDQLAELTQLYYSGALTKEQFEAAKNTMLGLK